MSRSTAQRRPAPDGPSPAAAWPRTGARATILGLAIAVPAAIDAGAHGPFNGPKFAVLCAGALVLVACGAAAAVAGRQVAGRPGWRDPWTSATTLLLFALTGWTLLSALNSPAAPPGFGLLGAYESYDGAILAAAIAVVFAGAALSFEARDVRRVMAFLFYGGGGVVLAYGFLQLHDAITGIGGTWDPVAWERRGVAITSTLANPNHLGAFLGMLLPPGIVLLATESDRRVRTLTAGMLGLAGVVLFQAGSRGSLFAAAAGLAVMGAAYAEQLRSRPETVRRFAKVGGGAALAVVAFLTITGAAGKSLRTMLAIGLGSSLGQRAFWWQAAFEMTADRPVLGFGPDSFRLVFPQYATPAYTERFGILEAANGAHNIVLNTLATTGVVAAALLVLALAIPAAVGTRAVLRLRGQDPAGSRPFATAAAASLTVGLVQSMFNVQQPALMFCLWLFAALLLVTARSARTRPEMAAPRPAGTVRIVAAAVVAAALAAPVLAGAWTATRPWRADRHFLRASRLHDAVDELIRQENDEAAAAVAGSSRQEYLLAAQDNPWEAQYPASNGVLAAAFGEYRAAGDDRERLESALELFIVGRDALIEATTIQPRGAVWLADLASVRLNIDAVADELGSPAGAGQLDQALDDVGRSLELNPWIPRPHAVLSGALIRAGRYTEALEAAESALELFERDRSLLQPAIVAAMAAGDERAAALHIAELSVQYPELAQAALARGRALRDNAQAPAGQR